MTRPFNLATRLTEHVAHVKDLKLRRDRGEVVHTFVYTGIPRWDAQGGIPIGASTLIAMPSGHGKSHVVGNIVIAAAQHGQPSDVFSMEDPSEQSLSRVLSNLTNIDNLDIQMLRLDAHQIEQLEAAVADAADWARMINLIDGPRTVEEVLNWDHDPRVKLRVVDYVNGFDEEPGMTLERTLAKSAWRFNKRAHDEGVAYLLMAQTNRRPDERGLSYFDRNPNLNYPQRLAGYKPMNKSDLADCTSLYTRCKSVFFGYRPGKHGRDHGMTDPRTGAAVVDDVLDLFSPKQNFGREGRIVLRFDAAHSLLTPYEAR